MFLVEWMQNKIAPIPHGDELKGKTAREMERYLRTQGMSRNAAKRFVSEHKARLRG